MHIVQVEIAPRNVIFGACLLTLERAGRVCESESEINVILQNFFFNEVGILFCLRLIWIMQIEGVCSRAIFETSKTVKQM